MIRIRSARMDDASAVAAIYNQGIAERSSTFETSPRSTADLEQRLRDIARYPLLVATSEAGEVLGWAGLSGYRPRDCYAGIGEFSVYLDDAESIREALRELPTVDADAVAARIDDPDIVAEHPVDRLG